MSMDFLQWTKHVPFIQSFWAHIAKQVSQAVELRVYVRLCDLCCKAFAVSCASPCTAYRCGLRMALLEGPGASSAWLNRMLRGSFGHALTTAAI